MEDEQAIEGTGEAIADRLSQADIPEDVIERLIGGAALADNHPHTWKCRRQTVLCEDVDPGSTTGRKHGYIVTCTVIYEDGSTDTIVEDYGC